MAHPHHENNDSYRLHRPKPDGPVAVFNQDGFLMAEHNPISGATSWHRVVPATKREAIEKKLSAQFPPSLDAKANTNRSRRRQHKL